ncbi:MAG: hypothetical protein HOV79_06085 [Hamadaea sp.]|nr:hypothetical protein [Hamadaea sp.]
MKDEYLLAQLQRLLAEDGAELGIEAVRRDDVIVLRGEVESEQRRSEAERRVADAFPELKVRNELTIPHVHKPVESEQLAGQGEDRH